MRLLLWLGLALFCLLGLARPAQAATVYISGKVTRWDNTPFAGVKVEVSSLSSAFGDISVYATATTDANGVYALAVAADNYILFGNTVTTYRLRFSADGCFFTQPGIQPVVIGIVNYANLTVNSQAIGTMPQLASKVIWNTPGLQNWIRIGDGGWIRDVVTGVAMNGNGLAYTVGKIAYSLIFNGGANDYVALSQSSLPVPWTLSFWANRQDSSTVSAALLSDSVSAIKVEQSAWTRKLGFTRFGVADYAFNYSSPVGQWVHVVMVADGSKTSLYINGVLQDTLAATVPLPRDVYGRRSAGVDLLKGQYEELATWNRALTSGEVLNLYSRSALGIISGRVQGPGGDGLVGVTLLLGVPGGTPGSVDQIPDGIFSPATTDTWSSLNLYSGGALWTGGPNRNFGAVYKGVVQVPASGLAPAHQKSTLFSDDGSRLYLDGQLIVNNDGLHAWQSTAGDSYLSAGGHDVEIRFFNGAPPWGIQANWVGDGGTAFGSTSISPVSGARVAFYNFEQLAVATTDANGNYAFTNIPAGVPWNITPLYPNFAFSPAASQPQAGQSGVTFTVAQSPPTISKIPAQTLNEDTSLTVSFTIFDYNTPLANLSLEGASTNELVIPKGGISFSGTGASRTLTLRPRPNASGDTLITVTVTDTDGQSAQTSFAVHVNPVNDPPVAGSLGALDLSGGGQVSTPAVGGLLSGNVAHTLEAWVKPTAAAATRQWLLVLGQSGPGAHHWLLNPSTNNAYLRLQMGPWMPLGQGQGQVGDLDIPVGAWTHLAATWDPVASNYVVYVNGKLREVTTPSPQFNFTSTQLSLGSNPAGESPFLGLVDEVRVWNRALTDREIARQYQQSLIGTEPNLVLYWRFDETFGDRAADSAFGPANGSASDGAITGAYQYTDGVFADANLRTNVFVIEDQPQNIFLPGYDVENWTALTYQILSGPAHGTLSRTSGNWNPFANAPVQNPILYSPTNFYFGPDAFTYVLTDTQGATSQVATVYIRVVAVPHDPAISSVPSVVIEEGTNSGPIPVIVGDIETPADQLQLVASSSDTRLINSGSFNFSGSGSNRFLTITPVSGQLGETTVTIQVVDTDNGFNSTTLNVKVVPRPAYAVFDLGVVNNKQESYGYALNDSAWVVGAAETPSRPGPSAFLYRGFETEEPTRALQTLGGPTAAAFGINSLGQITGVSSTGSESRGFLWVDDGLNGTMTVLPTTVGGSGTSASIGRAINSSGWIAGVATLSIGSQTRGVLWVGNTATNLGVLPGGTNSEAFALNDDGVVAGFSTTTNGAERATIYLSNRWVEVALPNQFSSRAVAINNDGAIVGLVRHAADAVPIPFVWDKLNGSRELAMLPNAVGAEAKGVNNFGQIVGQAHFSGDQHRAFFYNSGNLYDLNELLTEDAGWVLQDARAINKDGWITGVGRTSDGKTHAYLAVPAWVVGKQIARPKGAFARLPQIQLLGNSGVNNEANSFFWSAVETKLYSIRPVKARLSYFTSDQDVIQIGTNLVANTNRIVVSGAAIWPRNPTRHVAGTPVEVEPQGVPFAYSFQELTYVAGSAAQVEPNTKVFNATTPGYTVLRYLAKGPDNVANVDSDPPVFDVVRTHAYPDPAVYSQTNAFVGDTILNTNHFDYLGKNGFVLFEKAFYDGAGPDRAYDRISRRGAIIPVNAPTPTTSLAPYSFDPLVVVWYKLNALGVAWGGQSVQYNLQWPENTTNKIIIARQDGSGPLPNSLFPRHSVYNQPDPTLPGFNPNEEHALILPGSTGEALYALRCDLNGPVNSAPRFSAPFALLKYQDPSTSLWRIRAYKVVAEEDPWFFQYTGQAGLEIQPPMPLSGLPLCMDSQPVAGPWWKDYQGKVYARAAGMNGATTNVVIEWFYRLQPGFWYDVDANGTNDASSGTCIPWLDRLPGGTPGIPVNVNYTIRWPDRDNVLEVGQTLLRPSESAISGKLPEINNQAAAELIYDTLNDNGQNYVTNLARLYDPLSPRIIKTNVNIPPSIARRNIAGKEYFSDLPWAIKIRLTYDPVNKWLSFAGYYDPLFDVGQPLLLANVLSSRERDRIKALAAGDSNWGRLVDQLYDLSRNPNQVDLSPKDGLPDQDLRLGLATQYTVTSNVTFTSTITGQTTNYTATNYLTELPTPGAGAQVVATNVVTQKFGSGPKALTAALGGVPAAQPSPGNAVEFDGRSAYLATQSSLDLSDRSFTIEFWARRAPPYGTNYIFTHSRADGSPGITIGFNFDGSLSFGFGNTALVAPPALSDTNWHHWACVFNATTNGRAIYRDGQYVSSDSTDAGYTGSGPFYVGSMVNSNFFKGDLDDLRVWTAARSPWQISNYRSKQLNGSEADLFVYFRFDNPEPAVAHDYSAHDLDAFMYGDLKTVPSTAPCGIPPRYVTLAFNNQEGLPGLPVTLQILRVDDGPFLGDMKVLPGDNVFDQRLTFRHSSEFGGAFDAMQFQWFYKFDTANFDPTDLPTVTEGGQLDMKGWVEFSGYQPASGQGVNDVTIGEGGEAGLLIMSDTWWICRYRGYNINLSSNDWSGWVGDPSGSPDQPRAKLAEGWIKRVIRGLNPFDQRITDFHSSPVATYVSMIQQAGARYVGPIAFNPSADYLNSVGLIEAYETVRDRGQQLSIDGAPDGINFDPANNALLLVSSKISDLYMLLGNEAYADSADPTIGFGSSSTEYGTLSSSIFAFQNQLDSLLEEELTLLRGRDDSRAGVNAYPVYNHLLWNFTLGDGEVAYKQVYNIKDVAGAQDSQGRPIPDGFINEKDARLLYPQGHGDAWGHYLTALTRYYDLLRHPKFTWVPRTEHVSVAGTSVEVDFMDERKFARAAAALAKTGKEIVDLTYRTSYTEEANGQWQGYKDTNPDRAWGVDEWGRRAGMSAYFNWLAANTILPDVDPDPTHTGIALVDRTTVTELSEITAQMNEIQTRLDMADAGLNPLGLVKGAMVFDIDPSFNAVGSTAQIGRTAVQGLSHFEQIKERAVTALNNAGRIWDQANASSQQLRQQQDALDEFQRNYRDEEGDFKNRLIEVFGYPYAGDIGTVYPNGYDGPDLYHYMYVNVTDITGANSPAATRFTGLFSSANQAFPGMDTNDFFMGFASGSLTPTSNGILPVEYTLSGGTYGFAATPAMGARRAQGELQFALSDLVQANAELKIAAKNYDNLIQDIQSGIDLLVAHYNLNSNRLFYLDSQKSQIVGRNAGIGIFKATQLAANRVTDTASQLADGTTEAIPKVLGLATDGLSVVRGTIKLSKTFVAMAFGIASDVSELAQTALELSKEEVNLQTEINITTAEQQFEVLQRVKELESKVREEAPARLELYKQMEVVRQAAQQYLNKLAEGQRLLESLQTYRVQVAAQITEQRYQDMTFRIFRNDAIQKYRAQFDLAARYCYLAGTVYDYETSFPNNDPRAGRRFLNDLIRQRALGQLVDGNPIIGPPGLADSIARLEATFAVVKTQFGINNPQLETGHFGLRSELFRIRPHYGADAGSDGEASNFLSDPVWREQLRKCYVADLWKVPEFRRYCRPFAPESLGAQPGLVIPFSTTVTFGLNFFGWPLSGGDSAYDPTFYATKINAMGVQFDGYNAASLSVTPRVYLIPVGMDVLRSPTGNTLSTREWRIFDQALPIPFPIGDSDIGTLGFIPINDTLSGAYGEMRRFASMRAYPTEAFASLDDASLAANTRLVGRSVWNTQWLLIIPGGTLLFDPNRGIDGFINSVTDIRLLMMTYSYSGN